MKTFFYNIGYFLKETKIIFKVNLLSNIFSILSIGLIFFILTIIFSGTWVSNQVMQTIQEESEINVYFDEKIGSTSVLKLGEDIKDIDGVHHVHIVDTDEAYDRMVEILGQEANVLSFFEENPFEPFIEVKINLDKMDLILESIEGMTGVTFIRGNREVLDRLLDITAVLRILGYIIILAVGISTMVIVSHIIRQGIYNNQEQINTLKLLGAPNGFIAFPFLLLGLLLTLAGGAIASGLTVFLLNQGYAYIQGPLPFIPLPPLENLVAIIMILIAALSVAMGMGGSLFGLSSVLCEK